VNLAVHFIRARSNLILSWSSGSSLFIYYIRYGKKFMAFFPLDGIKKTNFFPPNITVLVEWWRGRREL